MKKLDKAERAMRLSVEQGEWRSVPPTAQAARRYVAYASRTLRKNRRINVRLSEYDLEALQDKAIQEGMPYQTLVTSVLHKYVSGQLKTA